jgi:hypothetical protein
MATVQLPFDATPKQISAAVLRRNAVMKLRWTAAKQVYVESKSNIELQTKILKHMTREHYDIWDTIDVALVIARYDNVTLHLKISFLVLWWFAQYDYNVRTGVVCPSVSSNGNPVCVFNS